MGLLLPILQMREPNSERPSAEFMLRVTRIPVTPEAMRPPYLRHHTRSRAGSVSYSSCLERGAWEVSRAPALLPVLRSLRSWKGGWMVGGHGRLCLHPQPSPCQSQHHRNPSNVPEQTPHRSHLSKSK